MLPSHARPLLTLRLAYCIILEPAWRRQQKLVEMFGGPQPAIMLSYMQLFELTVGGVQGSSSPAVISISARKIGATIRTIIASTRCAQKGAANRERLRLPAGETPEGRSRQENQQGIGQMVRGRSSLCTG